jgi:E3 ubiquitin-protein ligase RNF115/126
MLENILAELLDNYEVFRGMAATDDELDRLQRRAMSEEDISRLGQGCIICISGFVMGDIIMTIPCSHVFHMDCLTTWLMINGVCPLCSRSCRP